MKSDKSSLFKIPSSEVRQHIKDSLIGTKEDIGNIPEISDGMVNYEHCY